MGFFNPSTLRGEAASREAGSTLPKCGRCGLYKLCHSPKIEPRGTGTKDILFVGEAPGAEEDGQGRFFVGQRGEKLRRTLRELRYDLEEFRYTNALICKPTEAKADDDQIESCRPNILNTIARLKPKVIIPLGHTAIKSVVGSEWTEDIGPAERWVGFTIPSQKFGAWICPTYDLTEILEEGNVVLQREFKEHLQGALNLEHTPPLGFTQKQLAERVEVIHNPKQALARIEALATAQGRLTFDYETPSLKPEKKGSRILSTAFCLNGKDTFACEVTPDFYPALRAVVMNPALEKEGANIKFEDRWSRVILGTPVLNWTWDTMVAAHVLDNRRGITSLGFQAYVNFGLLYKSLSDYYFGEEGMDFGGGRQTGDVLLYNGIDALAEDLLGQKQKELIYGSR